MNDIYHEIDTKAISYASVPSTITQSGFSPTSIPTLARQDLKVWLITKNKLIAGSRVEVTLPPEFTIDSGTSCSSSSCTFSQASRTASLALDSVISVGTNLSLTFVQLMSPPSTRPTASLAIRTYLSASPDSLVDRLTSGLTFTATPSTFTTTLSAYPLVVNAVAEYTFSLTVPQAYQNSSIRIVLPTNIKA